MFNDQTRDKDDIAAAVGGAAPGDTEARKM